MHVLYAMCECALGTSASIACAYLSALNSKIVMAGHSFEVHMWGAGMQGFVLDEPIHCVSNVKLSGHDFPEVTVAELTVAQSKHSKS